MTLIPLEDIDDLHQYLLRLHAHLENFGAKDAAREVAVTCRFYISPASEFLEEAQKLLITLRNARDIPLSEFERTEITSVIDQIEDAFGEIGGA